MNEARKLPYLGGLDGLRAIAVIAVLLYHAELALPGASVSGGFLGVDVFFVLSGYLITSLLLGEWRERSGVRIGGFWLRRARRLLPAVLFLTTAVLVYAALFLPDEIASLRGNAAASLGYATNWYLIVHHESYFESWGRPLLLRHLWSLAIEEQFYVVWPLVFAIGMTWLRPRGLVVALLTAAAASTALAWVLYEPGSDPSRVYYGTDTRAAGLLIGSALAFVWPAARAASRPWLADAAGVAALASLAAMFFLVGESDAFLYQGGFAAAAIATAIVIAAIVTRGSRVGAALGVLPLRVIGRRSYSLYLWHWPVFMLTRPGADIALDGVPLFALRLAITFALAELSYRIIETPIRHGALGRGWEALRARAAFPARVTVFASAASAVAVAATFAVVVMRAEAPDEARYASAPSAISFDSGPASSVPADGDAVSVSNPANDTTSPAPRNAEAEPSPANTAAPCQQRSRDHSRGACAQPSPGEPDPTATATAAPAPISVTALGDSVMLGAAWQLAATLPNTDVHAEVGLQASAGLDLLRSLKDGGALGSIVVVHLGNNGTFTAAELDAFMSLLSDRSLVVFVNLKVPRPWEDANNAMLADNVDRYANAVLVDWHDQSKDHSELFWNDGIHLRPEGAQFYAALIAGEVRKPAPASAGHGAQ
jgi:peptidoglycan/LPS O-acetylase OafA/YrhL